MNAPIALFAWRRPDHLRRVLDSLAANPEAAATDVTAFCDGPRDESQRTETESVNALLAGFKGFRSLRIVRRDANVGLARNIVEGVTEIVEREGRVIVLEDDLVVSPAFLGWMNAALDLYEDSPEVASIHGYWYPVSAPVPDSFFLKGADCWGWGTWKRAWARFRPDGRELLGELRRRGLEWEFDGCGAFPYVPMLRDQIAGRNDSWAIRWHASAFLAGMVTLFPGRSLVTNIGTDGSGTNHTSADSRYETERSLVAPPLRLLETRENRQVRRILSDHHGRLMGRPRWKRWLRRFLQILPNQKALT